MGFGLVCWLGLGLGLEGSGLWFRVFVVLRLCIYFVCLCQCLNVLLYWTRLLFHILSNILTLIHLCLVALRYQHGSPRYSPIHILTFNFPYPIVFPFYTFIPHIDTNIDPNFTINTFLMFSSFFFFFLFFKIN